MYIHEPIVLDVSRDSKDIMLIALDICGLGWTLFQTMFGGRNSMSRSTFGSHNDKKNR